MAGSNYSPDGRITPGIITVRGYDADAERDKSARQAVTEQQPGSEFTVVIPNDLQGCLDRLAEIREEMGELTSKMYAVAAYGTAAEVGYSGPPAAIKLAIRQELDCYELEESYLQNRIAELQWTLPPRDYNNDSDEDDRAYGDPTQPGKYTRGRPAHDSALKRLYPDQGRE